MPHVSETSETTMPSVREPGVARAALPVVAMALFLGVGYLWLGLPAEPMIILAAVTAGGVAFSLGHSWQDMLDSISSKMAKTWPALLILLSVGLLIGTWMAAGTIPWMIYWGLKLISPQFIALTALVVTAIVAVCTGTSWGSAGTVGVAFMGVAVGMGADLAMVAGAVVAGAYFGDKMSPLSDTTNIASLATRVNLYTHIANLLWTTGPAFLLSAAVFLVAGLNGGGADAAQSAKIEQILAFLDHGFSLNLLVLIPLLIVLVGSVMRKPTVPVMMLSAGVAAILAILLQGTSVQNVFTAMINGFDVSMIHRGGFDPASATEDVTRLINRGGVNSMLGTLLICFCAIAFAGIMDATGSLEVLIGSLLRGVHSTFALVASTVVTCLVTIGVTCNGQISVLMPGEALRPAYIRRGIHPKVLGRTCEDAATVIEPILPWTAAGVYMASTLGVATVAYLPWAVLNWSGMLFALILAATGIGITRISDAQKEELLAQQ